MNLWAIAFLVLPISGNAYVFWRIWNMLPFNALVKSCVLGVLALGLICMFLLFVMVRNDSSISLTTFVYEMGTSWIFILLYLVMTFLLLDLGRLLHIVPSSFLINSWKGSLSVFLFITGLFVYAHLNYKHKVRQELSLKTEKQLQKPLKVVMMSDLHLGYHNKRSEFAKWVDKINAEKADMILIAGDIIDISVKPLLEENVAEEFRRLNAPVYACLGNHEYFSGNDASKQFYQDAGIRLLRDEAIVVDGINIIGRDDETNRGRKPLSTIMQGVDTSKFTILLDHQPYHLEQAEQAGIDFQLSGHTHYGQVWPISWIEDAIYENAYGHSTRGNTQYYVTSGMGIWGGKFRIGTVSEYVVAEIGQ